MIFKTKFFKQLALILLLGVLSVNAQQKKWNIDLAHSKIGFGISYFKVGEIKGVFDNYEGSFITNENGENINSIKITMNTSSINTNQTKRDEHLRNSDFFDAEKHPEITFESTSIIKVSDKVYELKGNFTMTGITKPLTLKATYKGSYVHPRFKTDRKFFAIVGKIPREDFKVGTNYKPAKFALGKEVNLIAEIQLIEE